MKNDNRRYAKVQYNVLPYFLSHTKPVNKINVVQFKLTIQILILN